MYHTQSSLYDRLLEKPLLRIEQRLLFLQGH